MSPPWVPALDRNLADDPRQGHDLDPARAALPEGRRRGVRGGAARIDVVDEGHARPAISRQGGTRRRRCADGRRVTARADAGPRASSPAAGRRAAPSARRARARAAQPDDGRARARARGPVGRRSAWRHAAARRLRRRHPPPGPTTAEDLAPSSPRRGAERARRTRPPRARTRTRDDGRSTRGSGARATRWAPHTARREAVGAAAGPRGNPRTAPLRSRRRRRSEPAVVDREVSRHTCLTSSSKVGEDLSRVCDAGVTSVCQLVMRAPARPRRAHQACPRRSNVPARATRTRVRACRAIPRAGPAGRGCSRPRGTPSRAAGSSAGSSRARFPRASTCGLSGFSSKETTRPSASTPSELSRRIASRSPTS